MLCSFKIQGYNIFKSKYKGSLEIFTRFYRQDEYKKATNIIYTDFNKKISVEYLKMKHMMPKVSTSLMRPHLSHSMQTIASQQAVPVQSRANKQFPGHSSIFQCTFHSFTQNTKLKKTQHSVKLSPFSILMISTLLR